MKWLAALSSFGSVERRRRAQPLLFTDTIGEFVCACLVPHLSGATLFAPPRASAYRPGWPSARPGFLCLHYLFWRRSAPLITGRGGSTAASHHKRGRAGAQQQHFENDENRHTVGARAKFWLPWRPHQCCHHRRGTLTPGNTRAGVAMPYSTPGAARRGAPRRRRRSHRGDGREEGSRTCRSSFSLAELSESRLCLLTMPLRHGCAAKLLTARTAFGSPIMSLPGEHSPLIAVVGNLPASQRRAGLAGGREGGGIGGTGAGVFLGTKPRKNTTRGRQRP